jgi:putative ABC transport system permease protein
MNFQVSFRPSSMALVLAIGAMAIILLGSVPPARGAATLNIIEAVSVEWCSRPSFGGFHLTGPGPADR